MCFHTTLRKTSLKAEKVNSCERSASGFRKLFNVMRIDGLQDLLWNMAHPRTKLIRYWKSTNKTFCYTTLVKDFYCANSKQMFAFKLSQKWFQT